SAGVSVQRLQLTPRHAFSQRGYERGQYRCVCGREGGVGVGRDRVEGRRLADGTIPADARLCDDALTLEQLDVRAHGVVGDTELGRQLVDGSFAAPEKSDDSPSRRASNGSLPPSHDSPLTAAASPRPEQV